MDEGLKHSPLPWRSVYPLGSKQNCAAVDAGDHYVYLTTFREDDRAAGTVAMHQANADLIVAAVNAYASTEAMRKALEAAWHALKSYEYGNASPDLAREVGLVIYTALAARAAVQGTEEKDADI